MYTQRKRKLAGLRFGFPASHSGTTITHLSHAIRFETLHLGEAGYSQCEILERANKNDPKVSED